ncbi:MAG TPA: PDZ domain-containing protein [Candidatus Eisenbacteria bacterium]|nr:PDZ domain-containing protein [Candidatus Eisenbacteria bacterium]
MRSRVRPSLFFIPSALCGVLAFCVLYAAARLGTGHPDVVYTLTPNPSTGEIRVHMEMLALAPGHVVLVVPDPYPSSDAAGIGGVAGSAGEPLGANLWGGQADANGHLAFDYRIHPGASGATHAMLLFGARTFAVPVHSDTRASLFERRRDGAPRGGLVPGSARRIAVRFRLPAGWGAYTPWGDAESSVEIPDGRFARLRESIIALGDYVPRHFEAAGTDVEMVTRGADPAREDSLEYLIRECLSAHAQAVGPVPDDRLLVVIDHPFRGDQAAGETALNATSLRLSGDPGALRSRSLARVVAHELFHFWNGGAVDLNTPSLRWFAEGVTEYFGLRALQVTGRMSADGLAGELAGSFDRLRGNPWADSSLTSLGTGYARDSQAWSATYAKGLLAAWALDLRLSQAGGLEAMMRDLVRRGRQPDLRAAGARLGAGDLAGFLDSLSGRRFNTTLAGELAARGLHLGHRVSGSWTLGLRFFRPGTTEVLDLDPDGPAARHGLRVGDRIVAVNGHAVDDLAGLADALADARTPDITLQLARAGAPVRVTLSPEKQTVTVLRTTQSPAGMASQHPAPGELQP